MFLCRTCDTNSASQLYELKSAYNIKYPGKQLLDLLTELIEINKNMSYETQLPQHICNNCKEKLNNAYDFVIQAREVNKRLLDGLKPDVKLNTNECCLQELPLEEFIDIKLEPGGGEETNPMEFGTTFMEEQKSDLEHEDVDMQHFESESSATEHDEHDDPLTLMKESNRKRKTKANKTNFDDEYDSTSSSSEDNDDDDEEPLIKRKAKMLKAKLKKDKKIFKCNQCSKSFRSRQNLNAHKLANHVKVKESHECPECKRKFTREETLQQHLKQAHTSIDGGTKSATITERKISKDIDIHLCKPHGCKVIQCMLCMQHFTKISELRSHLRTHPAIDTFAKRTETLQELAELFFPTMKKDITEATLLERINKDMKAKHYINFFSITNQAGYELRLESSDSDSDQESGKMSKKHCYACDLCPNTKYRRKYQLFEHQLEKHTWEEAQHVCSRCNARFLSKQVLQHHYDSQCLNSQKRFLCNQCPQRFRWRHNRTSHYKEHHRTKPTGLLCHHCDRSYDDKKSLTIHKLKVHPDSTLMPCLWCNYKFYRHDYFVKHLKRHGLKEQDYPLAATMIKATTQPNGNKCITCKICQLSFERIADLRAHILMELKLNLSAHQNYDSSANYSITNAAGFELHLDDSETDNEDSTNASTMNSVPYKCEICQVQCRRRYEMFQHQRAVHSRDPMPHKCDKCIFKCVTKRLLEHHQQTQCQNPFKQLSCEHCNYKFMWPENLEQHRQLQHTKFDTTKIILAPCVPSGEDPTTKSAQSDTKTATLHCPHCDRTYMLQSRLNNHIRDVHSEGGEANKKKKESERKFLCSHCGKETQSAAALVTHMRRHTGEKPFHCDMCEMSFTRRCEMVQHRMKHTGEKPYHCTVCGKDFGSSYKLKRHTLIHSGLKPYKCQFCEKCYRQSKDLKLHLQQHSGETPTVAAECAIGGDNFLQRVALEKQRIMRTQFEDMQ